MIWPDYAILAIIAGALPYEAAMLWGMLALSVANIVLGVWRPRFVKQQAKSAQRKRDVASKRLDAVPEAAE